MCDTIITLLPRTPRWQEVIDLVAGTASPSCVASATLDAAAEEYASAADDPGLRRAFWILSQIPDAAHRGDFGQRLRSLGLSVSDAPSTAELTTSFVDAVDKYIYGNKLQSDLGEMGEFAAVESMASVLRRKPGSTEPLDVHRELRKLAPEVYFLRFAQVFFARFSWRFLGFYVSRELPRNVGQGRRFVNFYHMVEFRDAFELHCAQASKIVEEFADRWYAKVRCEGRLTETQTAGFVAYALKQVRRALQRGPAK